MEREISFRTEQGLYYSYFKQVWINFGEIFWILSFPQLVKAPSLSEGLRQLQLDNKTESVNTINILHRWDFWQIFFLSGFELVWIEIIFVQIWKQFRPFHRFNVHQEVVLAALYKIYSFRLSPIFFYTYAVFALQVIIIILGLIMFVQVFKIILTYCILMLFFRASFWVPCT